MENKKIKIKFQNIFNVLSFLFLLILVIIYSYRFIHYRSLANPKKNGENEVKTDLYQILTSVTGNYYQTLKKDENGYYFSGTDIDNYIYYSGNLWRIISVSENEFLLISDVPITSRILNSTYKDSTIDEWLNNEYYNLLNKEFLIKTNTCINKVENGIDTCETKYETNVTLPSIYHYEKTGGTEGFMNNGYSIYFSNEASNYYYMDNLGQIHEDVLYRHYGITPMITISNATVIKGRGTKESPFQIEQSKTSLKEVSVGSYLNYNGYTWRIIENTDAVKMVLTQTLENNLFQNNFFSKNGNIRNYLNTTFYNSLENKDYILNGLWYTGSYEGVLESIKNEEEISYVGLPQIDDIYLHDSTNYALINPSVLNEFVYEIKNDGIIYKSEINKEYGIKPVIHIKNELIVTKDGTKEAPYEIVGEEN